MYQPGWPPLSPETIRTKSTKVGGRRINRKRRKISLVGDVPLFDSGAMKNSIGSVTKGDNAIIFADFPMNLHEQDPEVGAFATPPSWAGKQTQRPVMYPALLESLDPIVSGLEDFVGGKL